MRVFLGLSLFVMVFALSCKQRGEDYEVLSVDPDGRAIIMKSVLLSVSSEQSKKLEISIESPIKNGQPYTDGDATAGGDLIFLRDFVDGTFGEPLVLAPWNRVDKDGVTRYIMLDELKSEAGKNLVWNILAVDFNRTRTVKDVAVDVLGDGTQTNGDVSIAYVPATYTTVNQAAAEPDVGKIPAEGSRSLILEGEFDMIPQGHFSDALIGSINK